jgi:hypothetical protein
MTGPLSPYVTPDQLTMYPTGVSWDSIPNQRASDTEKYAAQVMLCQEATTMADARANQILRSTIQTEQLFGPGTYRVNSLPNGNTRLLLSQWPITSVTAVQWAVANAFPLQFNPVPNGAWLIERPPLMLPGSSAAADSGTGGQSIQVGMGNITWWAGRGGCVIDTTYAAGWPHCGLTQAAAAGDEILYVDDCTGWAPTAPGGQGCTGVIQDTALGQQEAATVLAATATSGPGILTLSSALSSQHSPGILLSALPGQIQWATVLYAASLALTRGATATTIQTVRGGSQRTAGGHTTLKEQADCFLTPFMRVV